IARLMGSDGVGNTFSDEDGLAVFNRLDAVDGFGDAGVLFRVSGLGVLPAEAVFGMAVVADRAATLVAGRPRNSIDRLAIGIGVRKDEPPLPERAQAFGKETGSEDRRPVVALMHEVIEQASAARRCPS